MNTNKDQFKFEVDGEPFAKLCVDLTLYWKGSAFDRRDGILDFYYLAMNELSPHLRFYETETMRGAKPVSSEVFEMIPTWFETNKKRRDIYLLQMSGGSQPNEPSDYSFVFKANFETSSPCGALRITVPSHEIEKSPTRFVEFVQHLTQTLQFDSGHGGYSLNWDPRGDFATEANNAMLAIRNRYLGIDLPHLTATVIAVRDALGPGIKSINWLTLLGQELLERVVGENGLRSALPSTFEIYPVTYGTIIRAGEKPLIGDVNRRDDLSLYLTVGKLLAGLRLDDHPEFLEDPADPEGEPTKNWLERFD